VYSLNKDLSAEITRQVYDYDYEITEKTMSYTRTCTMFFDSDTVVHNERCVVVQVAVVHGCHNQ